MIAPDFTADPVEHVRLLPIYILCDTSGSMEHEQAIDAVNEGLAGVLRAITAQGAKGNEIRICIISFSTRAAIVLPLTRVEMDTEVPELSAGGVTNLPDALRLLAKTIQEDYYGIRNDNQRAYRPAVFVFTDGRPTDERGHELTDNSSWLQPLNELKSHPVWAPRVYAYGFGAAQPSQLRLLVNERGVSDSVIAGRAKFTGGDAAQSIERLFPHLFKTITEAAEAAAGGATDATVGQALDNAHATDSDDDFDLEGWWGDKTRV